MRLQLRRRELLASNRMREYRRSPAKVARWAGRFGPGPRSMPYNDKEAHGAAV